jgi:TatA/E family protein of Tat protein translocase
MFGLGFWEIAIILAIALIVLGPSKLPELAKGLGKGLREFRKATEDFKSTIEDEMNKPELPPGRRAPGEQIAQVIPAEGTIPQPHPQMSAGPHASAEPPAAVAVAAVPGMPPNDPHAHPPYDPHVAATPEASPAAPASADPNAPKAS